MSHDLDSLRRENERLEAKLAETEHERDTLAKLNAIASTIAAELDPQKLVRDITTHATELIGAELGAWVASMDEQGVRYPVLAAAGAPREIAARLTIPYRSTVFEGKSIARVDDITQEPQVKRTTSQLAPITPLERELALRSYLAVPIIARAGNVVGALVFGGLAERYGRVRSVAGATALMSVMSIACALSGNFATLVTLRLIQGIGVGGEMPVAAVYINELSKAHGRGRFFLLYELIFPIGLMMTGAKA